MNISPKITSKTYYIYLSKSLRMNLLRRTWIGFLALMLALTPLVGVLWNPFDNTAYAEDSVFGWAKAIGGTGADRGNSVAIDSSGNVYTVGFYNGTVDFDPGAGTSNLTSAGSSDVFVSKLDSVGDFVWAKSMGGTGTELGYSIALDSGGNIYTTGYFQGTADFDPGVGTTNLVSAGSNEIFVSKLDVNGDFVWAKAIGSTGFDAGYGIAIDNDDNIYTSVFFQGTVDFDPGVGTTNLTTVGGEIAVSKLDSDGNFVWAKAAGGTGNIVGNNITISNDNNVFITGYYSGTADFDPGAGTFNLTSTGSIEMFVSKLDSDGNFVWAKSMGGASVDAGNQIGIDSDGNVYIVGLFNGTADFDPGAGTSNLTSAGVSEIFVSKLDTNGDFVWAKRMGGTGTDGGYGIAVDADGDVYTTGYFAGTADFDPGAGTTNLVSAGSNDIFLSKLDSNGDFVWAKSMGGTGLDSGYSLTIVADDSIIVTGSFPGTADFDPGASTFNIASAGGEDAFIVRINTIVTPTVTTSEASDVLTNSATLNGNITTTGYEDATSRGFEYGQTNSYGTTVTQSDGPYSTGTFTTALDSLSCGTTYYYRAFAVNSAGTGYSSGTSLTTAGCPSSGSHARPTTPVVNTDPTSPSPIPTTPTIDLLSPVSPGSPNNPFNPKSPTNSTLIPSTERFLRNLGIGSTGEDVKRLQQFLNVNEYTLNNTGAGSPSNETTFFGPRTKAAVKVFQETFASQILTPLGLTQGTGYFGESTRGFVNSLLP